MSHIIRDEDKESGVSAQGREQDRILNQYEYDAFGNTISCKEQVENRFRYMGEQYDPLTGQYYLRARYYNPVIARFTQEDTYYGDGLNLYTYCQNNPILNHDPTGHGTKENSPYSKKEQQYIDAGADPDTARLAAECYPDAKLKQDLYNKYKSQGYNATDAKKLANYEIVHGEERAKNYAANNVKKSGPDYTATFPRDNVNTDRRTQNRLNAQREAGAGKTSYGKSTLNSLKNTENFTDSAIEHIFEGQVNARGKAVGYHYEGIEGTSGNVIPGTESSVNNIGVYKAQVEVNGIPKTANGGFSTFYSKNLSPQQVVDAINEAYSNCELKLGTRNTYQGVANNGMKIDMFLDQSGKIISAFPEE